MHVRAGAHSSALCNVQSREHQQHRRSDMSFDQVLRPSAQRAPHRVAECPVRPVTSLLEAQQGPGRGQRMHTPCPELPSLIAVSAPLALPTAAHLLCVHTDLFRACSFHLRSQHFSSVETVLSVQGSRILNKPLIIPAQTTDDNETHF